MEFPTKVSSSEIQTTGGNTITLDKTVREVTGDTIDDSVSWVTREGAWLFNGLSDAVTYALVWIENVLKWIPWPAVVVGLALLSFAVGRWSMFGFTTVALLFIGFMGLWDNTIDTIALMVVAVAIAIAVGLPLGVLGARNRLADNLMRPILDAMQTMPSFVYLLPGILFFGLGKPAGIFATLIYAVPPVIRLTNLGIRQVSAEAVEAARSFGTTPFQLLTKVQVPMALPTIMAGINQTTMMALAMVTIASMVAAGGLGDNVLRALQKNQPGNGAISGLAIVFLAIVIDRLTQSVTRGRQEALRSAG
ncbi:MAG: proline/glycine betaine ABC transporter permease [Dehalococcoidia bacterium]|nr:proline/glycine betaine ABC transporter permease [Dehalococcoidia bacterium]